MSAINADWQQWKTQLFIKSWTSEFACYWKEQYGSIACACGRCLYMLMSDLILCVLCKAPWDNQLCVSYIRAKPFVCLFIPSSVGPSIHPSVHPSVCPSVHPFVNPSIPPSIRSFVRLFVRSTPSSDSFVHSTRSFVCPFVRSNPFIQLVHLFVLSFDSFLRSFIQ